MQTQGAIGTTSRGNRAGHGSRARQLLFRKLWLPRIVYELLPYAYMLAGIAALLSAVYSPDWTWILPYLVLLGLLCLHAGLGIVALRYRFRRRTGQPPPR